VNGAETLELKVGEGEREVNDNIMSREGNSMTWYVGFRKFVTAFRY